MAAKIGGGEEINLPLLLRILADSIDNSNTGMTAHLRQLPTGMWRNLGFTYMVLDNDESRPQDVFIDVMTDMAATFSDGDVVESEGQENGQETS